MATRSKSPKRPPGRPPLPEAERRQPIDMTLPAEVIEMAREIGHGNASAGVEIAVRAAHLNLQRLDS